MENRKIPTQLQIEVSNEGKLIDHSLLSGDRLPLLGREKLGTECTAAESLLTTESCCLLCCILVFFTAKFCPQNEPKQGRKVLL